MTPEPATTAGGFLLVPVILTPVVGMILSFALGGRWAGRVALAMSPIWLAIALAIAALVWRSGAPLVYVVGAVAPPLGIALEADGISAAMLVLTALILPAACLFARDDFAGPEGGESRGSPSRPRSARGGCAWRFSRALRSSSSSPCSGHGWAAPTSPTRRDS